MFLFYFKVTTKIILGEVLIIVQSALGQIHRDGLVMESSFIHFPMKRRKAFSSKERSYRSREKLQLSKIPANAGKLFCVPLCILKSSEFRLFENCNVRYIFGLAKNSKNILAKAFFIIVSVICFKSLKYSPAEGGKTIFS
jgi:hypothetical protein